VKIQLDKRWTRKLKGRLEQHEFEVGILNDATYRAPKPKSQGTKSLAGGPARITSSRTTDKSVGEISKYMRGKTDYLRAPFQGDKENKDIINFTKEFFRYAFGRSTEKRLVNLMQAIVRNPLARRDYGPNAMSTVLRKGFDRYGIDTGQFFRAILARVKKVKKV
jgi:hypothetical protein